MFWNKNPRPDTHEARLNAVAATKAYALDMFTSLHADLENAALDYGQIAADADKEAEALAHVAGTARVEALLARTQSTKIKELIGQ
jgi:hypothetical protein